MDYYLLLKNKIKITEIPISLNKRQNGKSKLNFKILYLIIKQVFFYLKKMINLATRSILQFVDKFYHRKRIFNYFKNKKFKLIFDIGANVGEYSELFKNIDKNIEIMCFEPQKGSF